MRSTRDGQVCPYRVIDDVGSGFGLGLILGSMFNFIKGTYLSSPKERIWGGILLVRRRAII